MRKNRLRASLEKLKFYFLGVLFINFGLKIIFNYSFVVFVKYVIGSYFLLLGAILILNVYKIKDYKRFLK